MYESGVTEIDGVGSTGCVVSELIDGESLTSLLERKGRLPLDYALYILEQSGWALQAAHADGFMHADVKPSNILITPLGKVKLTDFSLGRSFDSFELTRRDVMVTARYISPEQALGRHQATASGDVFVGSRWLRIDFGPTAVHGRRRADRGDETHGGDPDGATRRRAAQYPRADRDQLGEESLNAL